MLCWGVRNKKYANVPMAQKPKSPKDELSSSSVLGTLSWYDCWRVTEANPTCVCIRSLGSPKKRRRKKVLALSCSPCKVVCSHVLLTQKAQSWANLLLFFSRLALECLSEKWVSSPRTLGLFHCPKKPMIRFPSISRSQSEIAARFVKLKRSKIL